jgi:hypothetical protein
MKPRTRSYLRDMLILTGVLAILTLLALGQIAATVLIMVPLVFLFFGKPGGQDINQDSRK